MNKNIDIIDNIVYNNDNLSTLKIVKELINVVINDIEYMNDLAEKKESYDLGNNYTITNEDLGSLVSIIDTINNIKNYNENM